jgi:hypothetical protein
MVVVINYFYFIYFYFYFYFYYTSSFLSSSLIHLFLFLFFSYFLGMTLKSSSADFLVEAVGTLASLVYIDVRYSDLLIQHGLLDFISKHLVIGFADDDIILECMMLLSTVATDSKCSGMLANQRLIGIIYEVIREKIDDAEIVLQSIYTIFKMLLHTESRDAIIVNEMMVCLLLDLVTDPCEQIMNYANACLDTIMEYDNDWRDKIRIKRFQAFNADWLHVMEMNGIGIGMDDSMMMNHHDEHEHEHDDMDDSYNNSNNSPMQYRHNNAGDHQYSPQDNDQSYQHRYEDDDEDQ